MRFLQATLITDGKTHTLQPNRANTFEEIYADFQQNEAGTGTRYSVFLHPKQDITVQRLEIQFEITPGPEARFFANGYQSWSESRLLPVHSSIPRLRRVARKYMGLYGDESIPGIPRGRGKLHSWTYTYITDPAQRTPAKGPKSSFLGSLNERTGFTLFLFDQSKGILTVRKDMDGLSLRHSFPALDFWIGEGEESALFEAYFRAAEIAPPTAPPAIGWTSWYRHFTNISEPVLLHDLDSFQSRLAESPSLSDRSISFFQIDDGWQTAVGDWLSTKPTFPHGMRNMALKIKEKGMQPGIWLAPFVASAKSELVRRHPEWLLKDAKGRPIRVGWNPMWGGWYHALDFYHDGVREYLSGVFHTLLDHWGFELLKLDFLFAVALAPPPGKTRGGVLWEAMEFLRHLVGNRRILACGVPLGACFGQVDYCRIGGDVHLAWQHPLLSFLRHRERVDTLASLHSTLGRWQLNGRAFQNDPDVFFLRSEGQNLSPEQQETLLTIQALLGNLLFTSDDMSKYSEDQIAEFEEGLSLCGSRILQVAELEPELWKIGFEQAKSTWAAFCNLSKTTKSIPLANGARLELRPYETMVLKF